MFAAEFSMLETAAAWAATILFALGLFLLLDYLAERRRRTTESHRHLARRMVASTSRINFVGTLQSIAESALASTRAGGAIIALKPWTKDPCSADEIICYGRAGHGAPDLGARLQAGSGFSGQCLLSGRLLHCKDSEIDARLDREMCRGIGIRSMIAAPIRNAESVVGILEVFSPQPFFFTEFDQIILRDLAQSAARIFDEHKCDPDMPVLVKAGGEGQFRLLANPNPELPRTRAS